MQIKSVFSVVSYFLFLIDFVESGSGSATLLLVYVLYTNRLCHAGELGVLVPRGVEGVELHQRVFEPGQYLVHAQAVQDHRT